MLVRRELLIQDPEFPTDQLGYLTAEGDWVPCPDELAVNLPTAVAEMLVNSLNREANINAVMRGEKPQYEYSCEYPNPECHPGPCIEDGLRKEHERLRQYRSNLERIANIIRGELEAADIEFEDKTMSNWDALIFKAEEYIKDAQDYTTVVVAIRALIVEKELWILPIKLLRNKYDLGLADSKHICELIRDGWDEDEIIARLQSICIGQAFTRR